MSETINDKKVFSLPEVMGSIQRTLNERYTTSFWVKAEMNKLNFYKHSGHCYPDLVEKQDGKIVAEVRSHLWRPDFERINKKFLEILKEPLKDGIKILFLAKIVFDPLHGLSLWIQDIDPSFTLGDLEKEKQKSIQELKNQGIFETNKKLKLALLPQRIAVISVETSKGYSDFLQVLNQNQWGYHFFQMLFPSLLQGDKAAANIISQLKQIKKVIHHFDAVAIIRGGGGEVGLSCYNNFELSKEIALFPIPVLTGIGHSTNETVAEMVAFSNNITPTKLAEFLIQKFHDFSVPVQRAEEKIIEKSRRMIDDENDRLKNLARLFRSDSKNLIEKNKSETTQIALKIRSGSLNMISRSRLVLNNEFKQAARLAFQSIRDEKSEIIRIQQRIGEKSIDQIKIQNQQMAYFQRNVENMSPKNVLKRGYSISLLNGKAITNTDKIKKGDKIENILFDGKINSTVESTQKIKES